MRSATSSPAHATATVLVLLAGVAQFVLGIAAIAGADAFEDNVFEIESSESFGRLYFSLATWGVIVTVLGLAELAGGTALLRRTPNARLVALLATYLGLAGAFFTLAIFRLASLAVIVCQLLAVFLLSYHGAPPWRRR